MDNWTSGFRHRRGVPSLGHAVRCGGAGPRAVGLCQRQASLPVGLWLCDGLRRAGGGAARSAGDHGHLRAGRYRHGAALSVRRAGEAAGPARRGHPRRQSGGCQREHRRAACQLAPGQGEDRPVPLRRATTVGIRRGVGRPLSLLGRSGCCRCSRSCPPGSPPTPRRHRRQRAQGSGSSRCGTRSTTTTTHRPRPPSWRCSRQTCSSHRLPSPPASARRLSPCGPTPPVRAGTSRPPAPPCCWGVRRHPRCTSTTSRRRAAAASRKSARHPGPFATPTVQPR